MKKETRTRQFIRDAVARIKACKTDRDIAEVIVDLIELKRGWKYRWMYNYALNSVNIYLPRPKIVSKIRRYDAPDVYLDKTNPTELMFREIPLLLERKYTVHLGKKKWCKPWNAPTYDEIQDAKGDVIKPKQS